MTPNNMGMTIAAMMPAEGPSEVDPDLLADAATEEALGFVPMVGVMVATPCDSVDKVVDEELGDDEEYCVCKVLPNARQ